MHGCRVQRVVPSGCIVILWVKTSSTGQSWSVSNRRSRTCGWTGGKRRGSRGGGAAAMAAALSSSVLSCKAYSNMLWGMIHLPGVLSMFTPGGSTLLPGSLSFAGAAPVANLYGLYPMPGTVRLSECLGKYCRMIFRNVSSCSCNKVLNICVNSWRVRDPPPAAEGRWSVDRVRRMVARVRTAYARHLRLRFLSVSG